MASCFLRRAEARPLPAGSSDFCVTEARAGLAEKRPNGEPRRRHRQIGRGRRCVEPLGQLLGQRRDPLQLAADPAPPHLLRWVVAHEVAHRRHMDHGAAFQALEAELYDGNVAAARAELRR